MIELSLILLLLALVTFALHLLRRPDIGPTAIWTLAWIDVFATGALVQASPQAAWTLPPAYVLGSIFPALILAGALSFTQRLVPTWLLPGALLTGLVRAALVEASFPGLANGLALLVEPPLVLAAAWLTLTAAREPLSSAAQRLLPGALVLLALQEAVTAMLWIRMEGALTVVSAGWLVVAPLALVLQILALSGRSRAALRRAYEQLERRVEERTRELRESEERFRRLAEVSFEGIIIHERGAILEVNPALTDLLGYPPTALVGSPLVRLFVAEQHEAIQSRISAGFEGTWETTALRSDGSTFPVELEARSVVHRGRVQWVCAVRDIRERRRSEEQREALERHMRETQKLESLGVLAGGIAHDFNNLLTVMLGNSWVALEDLEVDSPVRDRICRVRAAGEQAAGLVEQLLTYSGKSSGAQAPLDLSRLVVEMLDLLRVSVTAKCTLEPDLEANLPAVDADSSQMRQVILNLVINAAEAMGQGGGRVEIRTGTLFLEEAELADEFGASDRPAGRTVFLEVADSGAGIHDDIRARIFEPFFTTKRSGRGLGLASVLGIVRAHAGAIIVKSELGVGSSFRVLLPASQNAAWSVSGATQSAAEQAGSGRILVVDDDEAVLEIARAFLERAGFAVLTASGGNQAIEIFRRCPDDIDAVVVDLAMPDPDGLETCVEISRIRSDVPLVVTSGYDERAIEAGPHGRSIAAFIRKPFEPEELVARILQVTGAATNPMAVRH